MAKTKTVVGNKAITPKGRLSFPFLFSPDSSEMGKGKFLCTILIDKTDAAAMATLKAMKAECLKVAQTAFGDVKGIDMPFRNGDEKENLDGYKGCWYIKPTSKFRPCVVGPNPKIELTEADVYAGCYVRASVVPFSYDQRGNKGVAYRLVNVQKMADGESFGASKSDPAADFDEIKTDEAEPFEDAPIDDDDDMGI